MNSLLCNWWNIVRCQPLIGCKEIVIVRLGAALEGEGRVVRKQCSKLADISAAKFKKGEIKNI